MGIIDDLLGKLGKKNGQLGKTTRDSVIKPSDNPPLKGDWGVKADITTMEFWENLSREVKVLITTLFIALVLIVVGWSSQNMLVMTNVILLSVFVVAVPQFLFQYERHMAIKEMEERFPSFLRDIIESLSAGIPLHRSIMDTAKFDYGKLSPEIEKMSNQISWGIPLQKVLFQFSERVKSSKRLSTSIKIIIESYASGGDVANTLTTVADHSHLIEESEKERKSLLNQYVILMYALAILFIIIVVAINRLMMPIFEVSAESSEAGDTLALSNPCESCSGADCMICGLYEWTAENMFGIPSSNISSYFTSLFFYMSLVQAIFSGLVAGQIGENSITAGVKHSLILVFITMGTFYFLVYFKVFQI